MKLNRMLFLVLAFLLSMAPAAMAQREDSVIVTVAQVMPSQTLDCRPATMLSIPYGSGVVYFADTFSCLNMAGTVYICETLLPPMSAGSFVSNNFDEVWSQNDEYECESDGTCSATSQVTLSCHTIAEARLK